MPSETKGRKRVALITGASYGIGAAAAFGLAQDGYDLIVTDLQADSLGKTVAAISTMGRRAVPLALDIRDQPSIEQAMRDAVAAFGGVDVLVNNAGIPSGNKPAVDLSRAEWDQSIAVNLTGTFFMSQQMGRHLISTGRPGAIISLASTHGVAALNGRSAYGIAKAGIIHMTKSLALEWAPHNIAVNAVAPGSIPTETRSHLRTNPVLRDEMLGRIPMGRFATVEEVAGAIRYLASPVAGFVTGQTLLLDGGLTAG